MKATIFTRTALAATVMLGIAASAKASIIDLVITEVNSTTLTYSWLAGPTQTATETSPDNWTFSFATSGIISSLPSGGPLQYFVQWEEPDYASSGLVNLIDFQQYDNPDNGSDAIVISDNAVNPNLTYPTLDNGGIYTFPVQGGNTVQFNDDGDNPVPSPGVPDGGSTLVMLGLAGLGTALLVRKLKVS